MAITELYQKPDQVDTGCAGEQTEETGGQGTQTPYHLHLQ
jgi:hypothetical protein